MALHFRCCVRVGNGDQPRGTFKALWPGAGADRPAGWVAGEPAPGHAWRVIGGNRATTQRTSCATTPVAGAGAGPASCPAARRGRHHEGERPPLPPDVPGLGTGTDPRADPPAPTSPVSLGIALSGPLGPAVTQAGWRAQGGPSNPIATSPTSPCHAPSRATSPMPPTVSCRPPLLRCRRMENLPRDPSVGWVRATRVRDLPRVVYHAHYLILYWIRLSRPASHLHHPRQERCRIRPLLLESRCGTTRSAGTCRAANWVDPGDALCHGKLETRHECAKPPKNSFVKPLCPDWKAITNR